MKDPPPRLRLAFSAQFRSRLRLLLARPLLPGAALVPAGRSVCCGPLTRTASQLSLHPQSHPAALLPITFPASGTSSSQARILDNITVAFLSAITHIQLVGSPCYLNISAPSPLLEAKIKKSKKCLEETPAPPMTHGSSIPNSRGTEATRMSIDRRGDEGDRTCACSGTPRSLRKEGRALTGCSVGEPRGPTRVRQAAHSRTDRATPLQPRPCGRRGDRGMKPGPQGLEGVGGQEPECRVCKTRRRWRSVAPSEDEIKRFGF